MADYLARAAEFTDVADAIRTKGGTAAALEWPDGFVSAIDAIETGGTSVTVDALSVTANGTYTAPSGHAYSPVTVNVSGGSSEPEYPVYDDGKTHLRVIVDNLVRPIVTIRYQQSVSQGVSVDWGDGSAAQTFTGTSFANRTHTYSALGTYVITLTVTSGTMIIGSSGNSVMGADSSSTKFNSGRLLAAEVGNNVTLGMAAFMNCYNLRQVVGVSSLTAIPDRLFNGCHNLSIDALPSGVTTLGIYAMQGCSSIRTVELPSGLTSLGNYAFQYCYGLEELNIPDSVTSIGTYAFQGCSNLCYVTLPSGLTAISNYMLHTCNNLRKVNIPSGVTTIGQYAFHSCYSLQSLTIPSGVTSIETNAFTYCSGCKEFHLLPTTPPTLGANAFTNLASDYVIYVPTASLSAYQSATNWSSLASKMQGE